MRLTIIKDDNTVNVGGDARTVDCSDLPEGFHALQWNSDHGEIEYGVTRCSHCGARSKKGNETITDVTPYSKYVDAHATAKATDAA